MKKEDMVMLIKAEESFIRLDEMVSDITGSHGVGNKLYEGLYYIYDVIRNNSKYADIETVPGDDYGPDEEFKAILYAMNKTAEEKYELLKPKNKKGFGFVRQKAQ